MKVFLYNDYAGEVGGAEVYLTNLENLLVNKGHEVKRCAFVEMQHNEYNSTKWRRFRHAILPNKRIKNELEAQLKAFGPDVIHIHNNSLFTASVLNTCDKFPIVQTVHDPYQYWPTGAIDFQERRGFINLFTRFRNQIVERHIHHFITHSIYLHRVLSTHGNSYKTTHIPIFTDLSGWRAYCDSKKENRIVFTGRIESYKGIFVLLDAFEILQKNTPDLHLEIFGQGSNFELLKTTIRKRKLMNINVHGKVDLQALRLGVARALVAIVPSTWQEPFGLSGIEAQACGTAVVASAVGGIPEWCIDGVTGLLAIPGDSSDLAKKIQVVLSDKPLRKSMIKQAQNHLEKHFSMEKHYIKLIEVYSNLSYAGETGSKDN